MRQPVPPAAPRSGYRRRIASIDSQADHRLEPMRPIAACLFLLLVVALSGCFSGSASNPDYTYQSSGAAQQKFFTLTWYTASLDNGYGTADGTVVVSWPGGSVTAPNYPSEITIPANVIVTVTATPSDAGAFVTWTNIQPSSIANTVTFYMSTNLTFGCMFNSDYTN